MGAYQFHALIKIHYCSNANSFKVFLCVERFRSFKKIWENKRTRLFYTHTYTWTKRFIIYRNELVAVFLYTILAHCTVHRSCACVHRSSVHFTYFEAASSKMRSTHTHSHVIIILNVVYCVCVGWFLILVKIHEDFVQRAIITFTSAYGC